TSKLDWTSPDAAIIVWDAKTLDNQLPYTGALGGSISVSGADGTTTFLSSAAFVAGASSEISLYGSALNSTARIEAPVVDSHGEVNVTGIGVIDAPLIALRGQATIDADGMLAMPANAIIFDSFVVTPNGEGGTIQMAKAGSTLSVIGGQSLITLGVGGEFDLDGAGDKTVNIADGSSLILDVEKLETGNFEFFNGTLNIDGLLHVETYDPGNKWPNAGAINLEGGEVTGRAVKNNGVITGHGSFGASVSNNGEIVADGGTLFFANLDLDGDDAPETGVIRAETGDIVITSPPTDTVFPFNGTMSIGDGVGVREVVEMNFPIRITDNPDGVGVLTMNGGFLRAKRVELDQTLAFTGDSLIRASGEGSIDRVVFGSGGTSTITGTLELEGDVWITPTAAFEGEGLLKGVSTGKRFFIQEGANTSDVSVEAAGEVILWGTLYETGEVHVANLTLRPTSTLDADISGLAADDAHDRYRVADDASIDGTLVLNWAGQGDAPTGETYTILTAGSVSGSFDTVDDSTLGFNRRAFVTVNPDSIEVFVTCLTDLNGDGLLDLSDITAFTQAFQNNDPLADLAQPEGLFDLADINTFVSLFQSGCN
ncbi:MAG: hypothetical protein K8E66_12655, partial [Phycisphaerales bacterium]|nr:hypothetical protein [Phycisphaerales bacterium]